MSSNRLVQILTENNQNGKYKSLLSCDIFSTLDDEDLLYLDEDQLIILCPTERDKILMHLATARFKDKIWPNELRGASEKENLNPVENFTVMKPIQDYIQEKGCLNLSRFVHSDVFAGFKKSGFTVSQFDTEISKLETVDNIKSLDLSFNNLVDSSAEHLASLICSFPSIELVNLQNNKFGVGSWNYLVSILQLSSLKYLIIYENPLASSDSKSFINKVLGPQNLLRKLIWIPKYWIDGGGWKMCADPEYHKEVLETHKLYYSLKDF